MLNSVFRIPRGVTDQSMDTDFPLVFRGDNLCNARVILDEGRIVSHAALWPREWIVDDERFKAAVVVAVATLPDHRRRGHAASLMRSLQQTLHDEQFDLSVLWTGVPDFYGQLGWELVTLPGVLVEIDGCAVAEKSTDEHDILPFDTERHLEGVMELHDQHPVRMVRRRDEVRMLFRLPKVPVWIAERDGQVAAYLVHAQATNKWGLSEYAGSLQGVTELVAHAVKDESAGGTSRLHIYDPDSELLAWTQSLGLAAQPLPTSKGAGHEMIYVVRSDRVTEKVRDQLFVWGLDQA